MSETSQPVPEVPAKDSPDSDSEPELDPSEEDEVLLGFPTEDEWGPEALRPEYFPSTLGGSPIWLTPTSLPPPSVLACGLCGVPRVPLAQVYAPLDEKHGPISSAHRTIYLLACTRAECHIASRRTAGQGAFLALRSQLPDQNPWYQSLEDENTQQNAPEPQGGVVSAAIQSANDRVRPPLPDGAMPSPLCAVCLGPGPSKCAKCGERYCSRSHQAFAWSHGHKASCGSNAKADYRKDAIAAGVLLPVTLLETEPEPDREEREAADATAVSGGVEAEAARLAEFNKKNGPDGDGDEEEMMTPEEEAAEAEEEVKATRGMVLDELLIKFQSRIAAAPDQVLRYGRPVDGAPTLPLWTRTPPDGHPPLNPPHCDKCGGPRVFEFQLLPQAVSELKTTDIPKNPLPRVKALSDEDRTAVGGVDPKFGLVMDWATVAVFTCQASCDPTPPGQSFPGGYIVEHVYVVPDPEK